MGLKDVIIEFDEFQTQVAEEMRAQRRHAGISLREMSEKTGFHQNTLGKCERGQFGIGLDVLYAYAKVLDRPLNSFISRYELRGRTADNPVADLTEHEMHQYSQLMQNLFSVFVEQTIKLSPSLSFEATRLIAMAIIEQRSD